MVREKRCYPPMLLLLSILAFIEGSSRNTQEPHNEGIAMHPSIEPELMAYAHMYDGFIIRTRISLRKYRHCDIQNYANALILLADLCDLKIREAKIMPVRKNTIIVIYNDMVTKIQRDIGLSLREASLIAFINITFLCFKEFYRCLVISLVNSSGKPINAIHQALRWYGKSLTKFLCYGTVDSVAFLEMVRSLHIFYDVVMNNMNSLLLVGDN
ncbi:hypothetical protein THOM_0867 [Trachipleistophora hominis]|uniref:Uncharacterized protein n=1 Tax=Trachipleistophora hominis TaxID=72359 RepID=L7JY06_TRAHO|nr:hypothetical protein THOM_0867 [Trachipleistophora hominis]